MSSSTLVQRCSCGFIWHENRDMVNIVCPRCNRRQNNTKDLEKVLSFPYVTIADTSTSYHNNTTIPTTKKVTQASINRDRDKALQNLTRILAFADKVL